MLATSLDSGRAQAFGTDTTRNQTVWFRANGLRIQGTTQYHWKAPARVDVATFRIVAPISGLMQLTGLGERKRRVAGAGIIISACIAAVLIFATTRDIVHFRSVPPTPSARHLLSN